MNEQVGKQRTATTEPATLPTQGADLPPPGRIEESQPGHDAGRAGMRRWQLRVRENAYLQDADLQHTMRYHLGADYGGVHDELAAFGATAAGPLNDAAAENDLRLNHPRLDHYDGIGDRDDRVVHHPSYVDAGNLVYGTGLVARLARLGGLREGMAFYILSSHAGDNGHNCPVICNFETARLLRALPDFPDRDRYVEKLETPSYDDNYTASQFLTEVQGGSDVGANATRAWQDEAGEWRIRGEKWFCSNADAELMVISARYDESKPGTKGLAVFLVPARQPDGARNDYTFRRLKEKMGTRTLASAEIDFHDAFAINLGPVDRGFNLLMEQVIHHSRIALATAVLGHSNRAYQLARAYADTRAAFGSTIIDYPLVRENLARIKADVTTGIAGTFALIAMQDEVDTKETSEPRRKFVRLMANIGKSVISKRAVDGVHRAIDTLAGNGAIETTSSLPRLFRDAVIYENWEGSHNTLLMQILRDFQRYDHDAAYFEVMREELATLDKRLSDQRDDLANFLKTLEAEAAALRAVPHDLQTMRIQGVIERMGDAFYYLAALREGLDQQDEGGGTAKLAAAELFYRLRMSGSPVAWTEEALGLLAEVVSAGDAPV